MDKIRREDGFWLNSQVFREEGQKFMKYKKYCMDPWGSPAWYEYWKEQRRRCMNGYTVNGVKITGEHYFYMNFCPIQKVEDTTKKKSKKIKGFPDFWDGDYNYFWVRQIAKEGIITSLVDDKTYLDGLSEEDLLSEKSALFDSLKLFVKIDPEYLDGGYNIIVGKSRRKGYSYKAAAIATCNYFTKPDSFTIFGAYEKKYLYPKGIFSMAKDNINFINEYTAWVFPSDEINKQDHIKASYIQNINGNKNYKGFKSELAAFTFKDNPDAVRGKDLEDLFFEESGAFGTPGLLKSSIAASVDCVKAGNIKTGMITVFGTSGDMTGGTADYADMFYTPESFGFLPMKNIWDEGFEHQNCGYFHPINWNMEGCYDEQGNSDTEAAKKIQLEARKKRVETGASSVDIQKMMQENPLGPLEAFSSVSLNNFPVTELNAQKLKVQNKNWQNTKGTPIDFYYEEGELRAKPILNGSALPITSYKFEPEDKRGCPMIYEYPVHNAPVGLYKIGYDPVRQDTGSSLASIVVYKSFHVGSQNHSVIVAEYIGRKETTDDIDRIAEQFATFYNAKIMHENEIPGVKNYFRRHKKLHLLAVQPDAVISKNIKNSKTARVYGCHMNKQLKDAGERYVKDWLLTVLDYDENGNPVTVIDKIYSIRLLEELIAYHREGNFDMVSSLFMCMFQVQEESLGKEYTEGTVNKNALDLKKSLKNLFRRGKNNNGILP